MADPTLQQLLREPRMLLAFGFGSGLSPVVPGTMGTLVGLPAIWLLALLPLPITLIVITLAAILGVYLCDYSSRQLGVHDHKGIVWDEFVGVWITFLAVPLTWPAVVAGFVIFRFFDMVKPWPICVADRKVHGGFGIMFDDLLAGLAALGTMQTLIYFSIL
ncbi:phosphatidylglycerophosphatase A [Teredinibacter turnerae T7901]|uniref:Phosphatidylglycerophosphatase A n=1 Tax=Teredinibacter turnerae (strain ATCC 39867 / T7901) TaxID=377629 RepID=C5BS82_TERTT|nr:phosphatidylglycerophosphatase A [Teredinibacter turnerae]ACR12736.1 phosphatidylglycerophosphatase A [Teredinibacter turnerae T7901]